MFNIVGLGNLLNIYVLQNSPGRISFTTDSWTSPNMNAFVSLTGHVVLDDWTLFSTLIDFREIDGSHSGENMAEVIYTMLNDLGIVNKVVFNEGFSQNYYMKRSLIFSVCFQSLCFTTDNATNNDTMSIELTDKLRAD